MIDLRILTGDALQAALDDVAQLRISVFRDWPYLYDGDIEYERKYLQTYRDSAAAILVGAFDGDQLVGASTGTPMDDHAQDFADAFAQTDYNLNDLFYCAESVLLPDYRGQGIGHAFFEYREAPARKLGFDYVTFCGVIRPDDHPLRPKSYRPLDPFWTKRGYKKLTGVTAQFQWKDVDQPEQTGKPLQFWIKPV